ncbi:hypothetical protein ACHAXA_007749 [Cyclostephanos tholiformis]|uniref:Uncharacterized protein n=1 Tax=Cyclostephanos tholiformis TaxID=382380 RepID=A0ABD3RAI6_9STRA
MSDDDTNVDLNNIWSSLTCSFAVLALVSLSYKFLPSNRGRNFKIHALYWAVAIVTVIVLPSDVSSYVFTGLTITLVGAIYPIYRAVKACCTPYEGDDKEWLQFWVVGGILFMVTTWVDDAIENEYAKGVWLGCLLFTFFWLYFPLTCGAQLVYDGITEPLLGPRVQYVQNEITTFILYAQSVANALHIYLVWLFFMILPSDSKRVVAISIGTVYPFLCSITAVAGDRIEDITYWLTYWAAYGCLFVIMDMIEHWMGQTTILYCFVILITVYLMLPMFRGADKVFRNILVPLAGLKEMLMLRDAYQIKRQLLKDLDPDRAKLVGKSIAYLFDHEDDDIDPGVKLKRSWNWLKIPGRPMKYEEQHTTKLNLV